MILPLTGPFEYPRADRLCSLPGNQGEMELAKARASLEDKLSMIGQLEAKVQERVDDAARVAAPLWQAVGNCLPTDAEAALLAALVCARGEQGCLDAAYWQAQALEAGDTYDSLGENFTANRAGWTGHDAVPAGLVLALASAGKDHQLYSRCAQVVRRLCSCAPPTDQQVMDHIRHMRALRTGKSCCGPARANRGHASPRRIFVAVPAARLLQEHGTRIRAWMRAAAPVEQQSEPSAAEDLFAAKAAAAAARQAKHEAVSELKAVRSDTTALVNKRVKVATAKAATKVRSTSCTCMPFTCN